MQPQTDKGYPLEQPSSGLAELSKHTIESFQIKKNSLAEFHHKKLSIIKDRLDSQNQVRQRKQQRLILYFINLLVPVSVALLNNYILLEMAKQKPLKAVSTAAMTALGIFISFISCRSIAPSWKEVFKLYIQLDSIVPNIVTIIIMFKTLPTVFTLNDWTLKVFSFSFPVWVIYLTGNLRVHLIYVKWKSWQILLFKVAIVASGLMNFYIGFKYLNGAYKITKGFKPELQSMLKQLVTMVVFGLFELYAEVFRKLCIFDQSDDFRYVYCFEDRAENEMKTMRNIEYENEKRKIMEIQLGGLIDAHLKGQIIFQSVRSENSQLVCQC